MRLSTADDDVVESFDETGVIPQHPDPLFPADHDQGTAAIRYSPNENSTESEYNAITQNGSLNAGT